MAVVVVVLGQVVREGEKEKEDGWERHRANTHLQLGGNEVLVRRRVHRLYRHKRTIITNFSSLAKIFC